MTDVADKESVVDETLVHLRGVFGEMLNVSPEHRHELVEAYHDSEYKLIFGVDYSDYAASKYRKPLMERLKNFILAAYPETNDREDKSFPAIKIETGYKLPHDNADHGKVEFHITYFLFNQGAADLLLKNFDAKQLRAKFEELRSSFAEAIRVDINLGGR